MDDASDQAQQTDKPGDDVDVEIRLVWQSAPAACARCSRRLDVPRPVARHGDELLCYHCLFPLLRPDWVRSPTRDKGLPRTPVAAILWMNEKGKCCKCSDELRTPGPVGVVPDGPVCTLCLEDAEPTLSWILRLAYAIREAQGYWPGAPEYESERPPGWEPPQEERRDWSRARKTGIWPSAILEWPYPYG